MAKTLKYALAAAGVALALLLPSGCGREQEQGQDTAGIQFMHGWGGSDSMHETMRSIYSDFSVYAPDVNVTSIVMPLNGLTIEKANDMLAVNKMADIVSTNGIGQFVANAVIKNKALDLTPYIQEDAALRQSIDPSVFQSWQNENGALYTVPDALEVKGYWYNEKIFQKAGIDRPPATWAELWQDCEKIRDWAEREEEDVTPFALEKEQIVESFLPAYIAGRSEEGVAFVGGHPDTYDTPLFRAGLQGVRKAYGYSRTITGLEDARQAFRDGQVAIYFNGLWECEQFKASAVESSIAYANYPTEFGETLSFVSPASGYVLCRSGDEARQRASVEFLKYILSEEQQTRILLETGQVPCNPNVAVESAQAQRPLLVSALKEARRATVQIQNIGNVWDGGVIDKLKDDVEAFGKGTMTEDMLLEVLDK